MVHHSQKVRMQNLCLVKKLIAQSMPLGAKTDKLIAVLCTTYGFHRRTVSEYLEDLRVCGIVSPYLPLPLPFLFSSISGGACLSRAILAYQEDKKDD